MWRAARGPWSGTENLTGVLQAQCATLQVKTPRPDWCTRSHLKTWFGVGGQPAPIFTSHDVARGIKGLVRDRGHGLRAAGLDADAHPRRACPQMGTQTAAAAPVLRRWAHRPR